MAVPKYKTSKARSRRKRSINMQLGVPNFISCSQCGNRIMRHRVCPKCGFYRGKEVFKPEQLD
ncbi:MAG: 50S ribosomal protein L32 [Spirochaetales bacterium]|nr:50S ribosomal protein L32 [Spirochaetales bacterium]